MPWHGRFASPDPARDQHFEETQSWNIYSYVRNNPVMGADPSGMVGEGNAITRSMSASADHSYLMQNEEETRRRQREELQEIRMQAQTKSTNDGGSKATGVLDPQLSKPAPQTLVPVVVEEVKAANPFGHVGIKVGGGNAVGLVPDSDQAAASAVARQAASAATGGVLLPSSVPGHVEAVDPNRKVERTAVVYVTQTQANSMQAAINKALAQSQRYDAVYNNCASFVANILRAGGINVPHDITPGGLVVDLNK